MVNVRENYHFYEPKNGTGLKHSPFNSIIAPRPIGWISSQSASGSLNLAPYSFFNAFSYTPPIIGFSSIGVKDTLHNIRETGQFCWNLVTEDLASQMNTSSASVPAEMDEFELTGLWPEPSEIVAVPHVAEAPVVFECQLSQLVDLTTAAGEPTDAHMVFGEVVGVHINKDLLDDGDYQTALAKPLLRAGGAGTYFTLDVSGSFEMPRPE